MFRRVLLENWMSIFPLIAFVTAASVYLTFFFKSLRMRGPQSDRFSQIPFSEESAHPHDPHV